MKSLSKANFAFRFTLVLAALSFISIEASPVLADPPGARTVKYSQQDIIPVRAKLRFSTLIVLPQNEEILDFATGDKEFWIINGAHNLCYVHPAQAGIRSDLHLITSSGVGSPPARCSASWRSFGSGVGETLPSRRR